MLVPKVRQSSLQEERIRDFHRALFQFYKKHGRTLPWRPPMLRMRKDGSCDPYRIFVSEFMLQQTQVSRVIPKYQEFLETFPTLASLANATLGRVLSVWSGLGYNRRAKHLHQAARMLMEKYKGSVPRDRVRLEALSGIGHSTASGILAFAYNLPEPMIDTNIRRILERVFFEDAPQRDQDLLAFAQHIIPVGRGREWNYALLDIGASVCGARTHDDARCPFQDMHGSVALTSRKKPQKTFRDSDRLYRGKIIRMLTTKKQEHVQSIKKELGIETKRFQKIMDGLIAEGLVVRRGGVARLP